MKKEPVGGLKSTTNSSPSPAEQMDNNSTNKSYKKIFSNKKCRCPFGCYICGKILGDLVGDVYKRDLILIENDKAVFWSMFEKGGID